MTAWADGPATDVRVLHVLEAVRGGTSRHLADVVRHTPGVAHHIAVPPPGAPSGGARYDEAALERMMADGAVLHMVDMRRQPWHPANAVAVPRLRALARSVGAQVVHGHSSVGGVLGRVAGRCAGVPVVYTANGVATGRPYRLVERAAGALTDRWVAVSASEAADAVASRLAPPDRIVTIPNGIDLRPASGGCDLRARLGLDPGARLVGTVARLVPQKAPSRFVRVAAAVAARAPDAHFVLIGMGPLQADLDREVAGAGLGSRWHQIEHIGDAEAVLGQLDVFVLASDFEGAPYTPLEAMRAGVPVVLTDVVGNRDAVLHGVSGFLFPPDDTAGLAGGVVRLLEDGPLRRRVTAAASTRLADQFDAEKMGRRLADLYRALSAARYLPAAEFAGSHSSIPVPL